MNRIFIVTMTIVFIVAILRVSPRSIMSAEEELIEHIVKASKNRDSDGINFFDIFGGEQTFIVDSSKSGDFSKCKFRGLNYKDPLIDIPLMPPELKM